jgi:hypothetical protein
MNPLNCFFSSNPLIKTMNNMTAARMRPIAPAGSVGQPIIAWKGKMKTRDSRKLAMISNISKIIGFSPANFFIYSSPF